MDTGAAPHNHRHVFEGLAYTSLALDAGTTIALDRTPDTIIGVCVIGSILAALIWASARRGERWPVGGLLLWFAYSTGDTVSENWAGAPEWLHEAFPPSGNVYVRVIGFVALALLGSALVVYFTKLAKTRAPQVMLDERQPEPAGVAFQPSWGPVMAMVWFVGLYASTMIVTFVLGDRGLIALELPDGSTNLSAVERVAMPLMIAGTLIVASRLRFNPLDALALRWPARTDRLILIAVAFTAAMVALFVINRVVADFSTPEDDVPIDRSQALNEKFVRRDGVFLSLIITGLLSPLQEEMMFRGLLLLSFFHTRLWFWGAAVLTSVLFALIHNFSLNIFLHTPYIVMGLAFAWALRWTGSLWVPILLHSAKNAISVIFLSLS